MSKKIAKVNPESRKSGHYIVAIGASAGGLDAIHEFFDHMPADTGFTFVVIQHLSPDYKSLLVDLVAKHTHMNVFEAANDMLLKKDCVYIIPNKKIMTIEGHQLKLTEKVKDKLPNKAIDTFLFSLANQIKEKAVAVILSGTGTDGTNGIEKIKEHGGMVMVQEPSTAQFDGMPVSAINSGNTDFVAKPSLMPGELSNYSTLKSAANAELVDLTESQFSEIFALVEKSSDQDFTLYKTPTISRRISRRMAAVEISEIPKYIELLHRNADEVKLLAQDFLINVTRFFRDKAAFDILEKDIIPAIVKDKQDGDLLKVWVCACSTGEEAYTIAILITEHLEQVGKDLELKIFATDLDEACIDIAAKNRYPESIAKDVPAALLKKYFVKQAATYSLLPSIRKQIVFAKHNVIKSPPFIKNDLITCRNMLIYMNTVLQQKIVSTFHYSLVSDGILFLGPSENASSIKDGVTELNSKWKFYKKTGSVNYGLHQSYTISAVNQSTARPLKEVKEILKSSAEEFADLMIEEFGSVAVFIDRDYIVKDTIGNFRRYLSMPEKKLDLNILNMFNREASINLNSLIRKAWSSNTKTSSNKLRLTKNDTDIFVNVTVKPPEPRTVGGYTIVMFSDARFDHAPKELVLPTDLETSDYEFIAEMEAELAETKTNLQVVVEEMETTNEELQSSNEELLSANEELQSGNEELQSLNEELHTLNSEHQLKIRELIELNDDLDNYFRSTDIGQIFIDGSLRIRKFNPSAIKMINLIDADINRPISHISSNILYDNLLKDIKSVITTDEVVEREIKLKSGLDNLMRIMPYLRKDGQKDGVVISFIDISVIKKLSDIISGVFNASAAALIAFREIRNKVGKIIDFTCTTLNDAANELVDGREINFDEQPSIKTFAVLIENISFEQFVKVVEGGTPLQTELQTPNGKWFQVMTAKLDDGFIISLTNVTDRKTADQKLRKNYSDLIVAREELKSLNSELEDRVFERTQRLTESEERFNLVAKATNDAIWDWSLVDNQLWRSENYTTMFGYHHDGESNQIDFWFEKIHEEDRAQVRESLYHAINSGEKHWSAEYRVMKSDQSYAVILDRASILHDEHGTAHRLVGSLVDVTRLIETERLLLESESRFKKIFDSKVVGITLSNADGEVLETNDAFLEMLGYTERTKSGMINLNKITAEKHHSSDEWAKAQLASKGVSPHYEKQFIKRNGEELWALVGSAILEQAGDDVIVSYVIDITKQKESEQKRIELQKLIKKQQDEFYSIFNNAPALINIRRGPDLIYEYVNKAFQDFGEAQNYIGRKSSTVLSRLQNEELQAIEQEVLRTGQPYIATAFKLERHNGADHEVTEEWFDFIFNPVFSAKDQVDGIAFFGFPVTDLVKGREATEELMRKKDEFMSIASHELKTPVTSLRGSLQLLDRLGKKLESENPIVRFIEKSLRQTEKLSLLLSDLTDMTKIQEGKMILNYSEFDALVMIKESIDDVRSQENISHELIIDCDGEMIIKADRARLEQVVNNFLNNAIKYSPNANRVVVNCAIEGDNWKLTVQDFGIGIPKNKSKYLFDRFYRVQESESKFSGLGLGLFISAEIITRHRGKIGVESTYGEGSTFWFSVPIEGI